MAARRRKPRAPALLALLLLLLLSLALPAAPAGASSSSGERDHQRETGAATRSRSEGRGYSFSWGAERAAGGGAVAFAPARVDLGRVAACAQRSFFVSVENRGRARVRLERADFSRAQLALATDVSGIHLDPGGRFLVELRFLPEEPADHFGAFFRVFTTAGVFVLPIHSQVVPNPAGVRAWRAVEPVGAVARHEIVMKNPEPMLMRVTEVFALENHLYVEFPRGLSGLEPLKPQDHREPPVLGQHNGYWEFGPGESKALVALAFRSQDPGDFLSYVHIHTDNEPYLTVPARIKVLRDDTVTIDPEVIDLGVLTSRNHPHREKLYVYNTHRSAIFIDGVRTKSLSPGKAPQVTVHMLEDPFILQARSQDHITVEFNFDDERAGTSNNTSTPLLQDGFELGLTVDLSLMTDSQLPSPRSDSSSAFDVRVAGKVLDGWIEYQQRETQFALTLPLNPALFDNSSENCSATTEKMNASAPVCFSTTLTNETATSSVAAQAGSHFLREIHFTNRFNSPLEIQRVYIDDGKPGYDDVATNPQTIASSFEEVAVVNFSRPYVAQTGDSWPAIQLNISPSLLTDDLSFQSVQALAAYTHMLVVATNATIHKIPLHFFHGILRVTAIRVLSLNGISGFTREMDTQSGRREATGKKCDHLKNSKHDETTGGCSSVYNIRHQSQAASEARSNSSTPQPDCLDDRNVRMCRSLLLDLGKIARGGETKVSETFTITNDNPIPISLTLVRVRHPHVLALSMHTKMMEFDEADETLKPLSKLQAKWRQNSSFVLENQRQLDAVMSTGPKNASFYSTQFVLPPGHSTELNFDITFADSRSELSAHLVTIQTPYEDIHVHAVLKVVSGAVTPVYPEIMLDPMFAGQSTIFEMWYQNSFSHDVEIVNVSIPAGMELVAINDVIPANAQAARTLSVQLSLKDIEQCRARLNQLDCLIPTLDDPVDRDFALSGFGGPVTRMDIRALRRRDEFWFNLEHQGKGETILIQTSIKLHTELSRDAVSTDIIIPLLRSQIVVSAFAPDFQDPPMYAHADQPLQIVFPKTQTRHLIRMFVNMTNPSTSTVRAELACHEDNQALFFVCNGAVIGNDDSECLVKWQTMLIDDSTCRGDDRDSSCGTTRAANTDPNTHAPLFYLPQRRINIPGGEHALIGPIYYLPMDVHRISLSMFIRNDLSHIEQLDVVASSGSAMLTVGVLPPAEGSGISITHGEGNRHPGQHDYQDAENNHVYGTIEFVVEDEIATKGEADENDQPRPRDFSRHVDMHFENTGDFPLTISKVWLGVPGRKDGDSDDSVQMTNTPAFYLESLPDQVSIARMPDMDASKPVVGENGAVLILNPGDVTHFVVSFKPLCYTISDEVYLFVESTEGIRTIRFTGRISTNVAFACADDRAILPIQLLKKFWVVTFLAGVACIAFIILEMLKTSVLSAFEKMSKVSQEGLSEIGRPLATESIPDSDPEFVTATTEVERLLHEIEVLPFKPTLPMSIPAVTAVVEQRQRGVFDPVVILKSLVGGELSDIITAPDGAQEDLETSTEPEETSDGTRVEVEDEIPDSVQLRDGVERVIERTETPAAPTLSEQFDGDRDGLFIAEIESQRVPAPTTSNTDDAATDPQPKTQEGKVGRVITSPTCDLATTSNDKPGGNFEGHQAGSDKVNEDLGWSLWESKSLWVSSAENNPLEGNRDLIDGRGLSSVPLQLSSLDLSSTPNNTELHGRELPFPVQNEFHANSSAIPPMLAPPTEQIRSRAVSATKAPPGFTPADATPLEARAAFEKLRPRIFSSIADSASSAPRELTAAFTHGMLPQASNGMGGSLLASLESTSQPFVPFGPILPDSSTSTSSLGGIGSKRLASYREIWADLGTDEQPVAPKREE